MEYWNEIRTAYAVARLGTISAAAKELGLHRITVTRHIDILEHHLDTRIFQRHTKGYTPTETGKDLLEAAKTAAETFHNFASRARNRKTQVTGEIVVTSVEIISPLMLQAISKVREDHPHTNIRYIVSGRLLNLAHGEAHIAIRAGTKPTHPDNVVRPFFNLFSTLYAHAKYVDKYGLPESLEDFDNHQFILHQEPQRTAFFQWLESHTSDENIVLRSQNQRVLMESISMGLGIGFMPQIIAQSNPDLYQVMAPQSNWFIPLWLVTHVDLHRTHKVQEISRALMSVSESVSGSTS